jgi:protein-tyrosine phosphatase
MDTAAGTGRRAEGGERRVPFEGVLNFRDLGGYRTASGGSTRWRLVFRSDALFRLTADDLVTYESFGIRAVYDLRSAEERVRQPNPMACRAIGLEDLVPRDEFNDGSFLKTTVDAERRLREVYLAVLETAGPLFGELFSGLVEPGGLPAVFHCAGGKDRTGLAAALLLSWLGVDREAVLDDYELTAKCWTAEREREVHGYLLASGMSVEAATAFLGVPRWAMSDTLAALDDTYGGIEAYLRNRAAMSPATMGRLRQALVG